MSQAHLSPTGRGTSCQSGPATSHLMPRNIAHSDILVDPESESEMPYIAPEAEDQREEVGEEAEGEGEDGREDENKDGDGDKREGADEGEVVEGEEVDEPEDEEDEEPGIATRCRRLSSPSVSPLPAETTPSRSSWLRITLKLPTQTQKPSRAPRAVHKDKDSDSDMESEDDDEYDHPHGQGTKQPLTTRQAVLRSIVGFLSRLAGCVDVPHPFLSTYLVIESMDETSRKKKQLNEAKIALRCEETARKRKNLSEKMKRCLYTSLSYPTLGLMSRTRRGRSIAS
ncbi:hypothetical protein BC827DRAFT_219396 [Russula dissimulans]|nr:hypothetical protein BC827DRAFT_219396 [Russula dissimulans]